MPHNYMSPIRLENWSIFPCFMFPTLSKLMFDCFIKIRTVCSNYLNFPCSKLMLINFSILRSTKRGSLLLHTAWFIQTLLKLTWLVIIWSAIIERCCWIYFIFYLGKRIEWAVLNLDWKNKWLPFLTSIQIFAWLKRQQGRKIHFYQKFCVQFNFEPRILAIEIILNEISKTNVLNISYNRWYVLLLWR